MNSKIKTSHFSDHTISSANRYGLSIPKIKNPVNNNNRLELPSPKPLPSFRPKDFSLKLPKKPLSPKKPKKSPKKPKKSSKKPKVSPRKSPKRNKKPKKTLSPIQSLSPSKTLLTIKSVSPRKSLTTVKSSKRCPRGFKREKIVKVGNCLKK